ncbi:MAG: methyltransferase domain-containing protein [Actinobacteria bacterium]|nr:methyltransferase domain-containing protein [Actinomycetota bacterium]
MPSSRIFYKWFYDNIHSHYYNLLMKWCFFPFGGEYNLRSKLLSEIYFNKDDKILDMCCGTGNTTFVIAEKINNNTLIKGINLSDGQIRIANKNNHYSNVEFKVMDATKTIYLNEEFDKIIIPHALHEMNRNIRIMILKETMRILKKGGTIIILEMDNPPNIFMRVLIGFLWFYWLPFNFETPTRRDMLKHGLIEELKEAGFINISKTNMFKGVFQIVQGYK